MISKRSCNLLANGITSSPQGTGSAPPGKKSFWRSTIINAFIGISGSLALRRQRALISNCTIRLRDPRDNVPDSPAAARPLARDRVVRELGRAKRAFPVRHKRAEPHEQSE